MNYQGNFVGGIIFDMEFSTRTSGTDTDTVTDKFNIPLTDTAVIVASEPGSAEAAAAVN